MSTKFDAWKSLLGDYDLALPANAGNGVNMHGLNLEEIKAVSERLRALLWRVSPELVTSAESFCETVLYMPASATGNPPEVDKETGQLGISPRNINPGWCEVPILWTLTNRCPGLVGFLTEPEVSPPRNGVHA